MQLANALCRFGELAVGVGVDVHGTTL
jgi:hypothetical protein